MSDALTPVVLIDYLSVVYRWYHAMHDHPLMHNGLNTTPIHGFISTLLQVLHKVKTDRVVVCMDCKTQPCFRKTLDPEYKSNRKPMEEDLALALPHLEILIDNLMIPRLTAPGFEADDIIGTLTKKAEEAGLFAVVVSNDKDLLQLVSYGTNQLRQGKHGDWNVYTPQLVRHEFGFRHPAFIADYLALKGDAVDCIKGVPGIGETAASQLVSAFGSLDEIFDMQQYVPAKYWKKLAPGKEIAYNCLELTRVCREIPFEDLDIVWKRPPAHEARELFSYYNMNKVYEMYAGIQPVETKLPDIYPPINAPELEIPTGYLF